MQAFTWSSGQISQGIALAKDDKLGDVVFLGEAGRGRRYEKVALGRRNPAAVVGGKVLEAQSVKITLPARDGKPEKVFYVLEKPKALLGEVLVRVSTLTSYVRGARGYIETVAGTPETVIAGYGAFGDAGRVGSWTDSLVVLRPGDVLRIHPSRGECSYALWLEGGTPTTASWKDYQNILAVQKAETVVAQAAENPAALDLAFGQMPCFTWQGGRLTEGLELTKGATGPVVAFGEKGRGRSLLEVPVVGFEPGASLLVAGVAKLDEQVKPARYSWDKPETKVIYGLTQSATEEDAFLVRICTGRGYTRRGDGTWEAWKGNPTLLGKGNGADGDAGGIGSWDDGLWVLREGDVVRVRPSGGSPAYALLVQGDVLRTEPWITWKVSDGHQDPGFYVQKGSAPWGHVPIDWIGRVVTVQVLEESGRYGDRELRLEDRQTGELISVSPTQLVLNLGWDGRDRKDVSVTTGTWVKFEESKQVHRLEGEAAVQRQLYRQSAHQAQLAAMKVVQLPYFALADALLRDQLESIAREAGFDTMATGGCWESLSGWVQKATDRLQRFGEAESGLLALHQRQQAGEILVDFSAWHRVGGATNQGNGWVIRPDGTLRDRDSDDVRRHKSDGTYCWRMVEADELALVWRKAYTAAPHEFVVAKLPVGGCTAEQLCVVATLEAEIHLRFGGTTGLASGIPSPGIGQGWGLVKHQPNDEPAPDMGDLTAAEKLAALRGHFQNRY